jgi:Ca2+-binding RTX toxin-like protein
MACSAVLVLAFSAASASAGVTTVNISNYTMYVTAPTSIPHQISVFEIDGTSNLFIKDFASGNTTNAYAPCVPKTISGSVGVSCPRSQFGAADISTGAAADSVDYRTQSGAKVNVIVHTKGGNDGVVGPIQSTSPSSPYMTIYGGTGNDNLTGGSSLDGVYGEAGDDKVDGYLGSDDLGGGTGNDEIFAKDSSRDTVDCGENSGDNDLAHVDLNNLDTLIGASCERVQTF